MGAEVGSGEEEAGGGARLRSNSVPCQGRVSIDALGYCSKVIEYLQTG